MNESTDWASALAILAAGAILGTIFIVFLRRRKEGLTGTSDRRADLEEKRDLLLDQLREDAIDETERLRLERETADVLRALDRCADAAAPAAVARANPAIKGFLWGLGAALLVAALGVYVYSKAETKPSDSPVAAAPAQTASNVSQVQQLEQAVAAEPDNITKRIELARLYFDSENLMGVFEQTNAILAKDPNEPRALTYNAIARMAMGQNEQAKAMLEKVTAAEPDLLDAWVALASVRMNLGDKTAASAAIDAAIARHPEAGPRLREVFAEISTTQPEAMPPSPHATASDPLAAAPAPGTPSIHVTLSLAPSASAKSGVVYVIAKSEGENGGHPVAVRRIDGAAFPLSIDLDATSSMMGGSFPKKVRVEARLDSDGDAGTNDAADPKAFVDGVSAGSRLVMKLE